MRLIEEQILHKNYLIFKRNKQKDINEVFKTVESFKFSCVKNLAIKSDIKFFDELSFILSVISSITSKPLLITKNEEVLLRSDQVPSIQYESFNKTIKDSKLWKKKKFEMLPESIYFNQSSDEIATYENIFIVSLIDLIDLEISKYNTFYYSIINTFDGNSILNIDSKLLNQSLNYIANLERKLKFIKNTYFYKEVKRKHITLNKIQPTNILLKNRLYNYCYKFYRSYIKIEEDRNLVNELKSYYLLLILKGLKKKEYKSINKNKILDDKNLSFRSKDFNLNIEVYENKFIFNLKNRFSKELTKISLYLDVDYDFKNIKEIDRKSLLNFEINLFKLNNLYLDGDILKNTPVNINSKNEEDLINIFLNKIDIVLPSSSELYTRICPICKSNHITFINNDYICDDCKSIYNFYKKRTNEYIYLKKVRRG